MRSIIRSAARAKVAAGLVLALSAGAAMAQAPRAPAVTVAPATIEDVRTRATFQGRLRAAQSVDLRARVQGFLEEVGFAEGTAVSAGTVLFRIEDDAFRARVAEIEGQIAAAEAERQLAVIERDRQATLVARQAVARQQLDIAEANLGRADGEIARLRAMRDRALLDLSYAEIVAPFDGVAGLAAFDPGAFVGPESGTLVTLTRLDPMRVEFEAPTATVLDFREAGGARDAVRVDVILPNGRRHAQPGRIDFVDAAVGQMTDTVTVRAAFDNPGGVLPDGALVTVELAGDAPELVLSVPRRAVQRDQVGAFVLVVDGESRVALRRVQIERATRELSVVSAGLEEGELVITEGLNAVRPGIVVDAALAGG